MSEHDPSLEAIMRTDRFVDALADGARMSAVDPLSAMLGTWRDDVRSRPDEQVVTLDQASAALAKAQKPPRGKRIGLAVVGAVAAALLVLGGFLTIGNTLFGGSTTQTRTDAVALAAQTELAQVQQLVDEGKWEEAQQKLVNVGPTVQSVPDLQSRQELVQQYNQLTVQVVERDPEATLPPAGEPLPALPESPLTFLVPVIDATTTTTPVPELIAPLPTPSGPLPTPTGPLPTPSGPLPTPSGPLPTPTGPLPTPTGPLPTPSGPLPTPTGPLPTPSGPLPTPTASASKPTAPAPPKPTAPAPPVVPSVAATSAPAPRTSAPVPPPPAAASPSAAAASPSAAAASPSAPAAAPSAPTAAPSAAATPPSPSAAATPPSPSAAATPPSPSAAATPPSPTPTSSVPRSPGVR